MEQASLHSKLCERCRQAFECGMNSPEKECWCAAVTLSPEVREELREKYSDCLCRQCLDQLIALGSCGRHK